MKKVNVPKVSLDRPRKKVFVSRNLVDCSKNRTFQGFKKISREKNLSSVFLSIVSLHNILPAEIYNVRKSLIAGESKTTNLKLIRS